MKNQRLRSDELAGIQYLGLDGITQSCISALTLLFTREEKLIKAALLTVGQVHGFLVWTESQEIFAIKAGFSSGYGGEGPRGLAVALALLIKHRVDVEEYMVDPLLISRLSASCLLHLDIENIAHASPARPSRWHDYIYEYRTLVDSSGKNLARHYGLSVPFALIDDRIMDCAVSFREDADAAIILAYRRLEDIFRKRTGLKGEGTRLFGNAFSGAEPLLRWDVPDDGESKGRAQLFSAVYMAFRNARVHRELEVDMEAALREFLLVNELFRLEAEARTETQLLAERRSEDNSDQCSLPLTSTRPNE
jgi:hypothetical protein